MTFIRPPAVAGKFYPADPTRLSALVGDLLQRAIQDAATRPQAGPARLRAIIAPHAGYAYSGPIAASAYAHVAAGPAARAAIRRVVLLGPAHRAPLRGLGASSAGAFATPLGDVPLDRAALQRLLPLPFVGWHDEAHEPEHGLEVHLPFLQLLLADFRLLPLVVGPCAPEDVAAVLEPFAEDAHTLLVVSSDLSHFHDYEEAQHLDRHTARRIEGLHALAAADACGRYAINGLLHLARQRGWQARTVDLRSSGDTRGPRDRVVGYGAFIFEGFPLESHLME